MHFHSKNSKAKFVRDLDLVKVHMAITIIYQLNFYFAFQNKHDFI